MAIVMFAISVTISKIVEMCMTLIFRIGQRQM